MEQQRQWYEQVESITETVESPSRPNRWRVGLAAGTVTLGLTGVAAGFVINGAGETTRSSVAQAATTTTVAGATDKDGSDKDGSHKDRAAERVEARTKRLSEMLQPLVDDGTITDAQRDAVVKRLVEAAPEHRPFERRSGMGERHRGGRGLFGTKLDAAASALGISLDDLRTALRDGSSIADVAKEKGVDVQTVIDKMVKSITETIEEMDLPEGVDPPTESRLREAVEAMVNRDLPKMPWIGELGGGHRGGHGPDDVEGGKDTTTTTVN
ncbi:MAG: hypothetical protein IT195_12215 [Microthrixaceae bacterium]|nr:hypothetical protein [Microthrixaceae bacterium]